MFTEPCQLLEWDTEFFGFHIARVNGEILTPSLTTEIDHYCTQNRIQCLYFKALSNDLETTLTAEGAGFNLVDIRMVLVKRDIGSLSCRRNLVGKPILLRKVQTSDISTLREIAGGSHQDSRFFFDERFPRNLSGQLFKEWISKSCAGYADQVFVAVLNTVPIGYISCHLGHAEYSGSIGLVGVSKEAQGQGVGQALVERALGWFASRNIRQVSVTTQGRNQTAQRLYQRCGFLTESVHLLYHKWYNFPVGE